MQGSMPDWIIQNPGFNPNYETPCIPYLGCGSAACPSPFHLPSFRLAPKRKKIWVRLWIARSRSQFKIAIPLLDIRAAKILHGWEQASQAMSQLNVMWQTNSQPQFCKDVFRTKNFGSEFRIWVGDFEERASDTARVGGALLPLSSAADRMKEAQRQAIHLVMHGVP